LEWSFKDGSSGLKEKSPPLRQGGRA